MFMLCRRYTSVNYFWLITSKICSWLKKRHFSCFKSRGRPYSMAAVPRFLFQGLTAFSLAKRTRRRCSLWRGKLYLRNLENILERGNPNCHHMVLLLKAECISFDSDESTVQRVYNEAIKSAAYSGFTHSQALANERAGKYFLERNEDS